MNEASLFHPLLPGGNIEGDWHNFPIPTNIVVGENCMIDSSSCFKKFFSRLPIGLKVGNNVTIQSTSLSIESEAYLEIGEGSYLSAACIAAYKSIIIGKYVFIAGGATIVDTDFHPLDPGNRLLDTIANSTIGDKTRRPHFQMAPVIIEDDVWIGFNATILKGVTVGQGSVIQPGAVVSKNVPPRSIVTGNPALIQSQAQ